MKNLIINQRWKNPDEELPEYGGRFWCIVKEVNDLGISTFQWNCAYNDQENRWSDDHETLNVIWWTELPNEPSK